jgi:hypothetical protein
LFKNTGDYDRVARNKSTVAGAVVTISQFGKIAKDTTDESGMVVFNGFFRTAVNVTIQKEGFTTVSYISVVNKSDSTVNSGIYSVGNLIPVFELTGQNTAIITGRATIETNLTNKTRENAPDGTVITANIDITEDNGFPFQFLTSAIDYYGSISGDSELIYVGSIVDAAYSTDIFGTVTNGAYSITVPAAIDGLPLSLEYSAVVANQTLYEFTNGNKVATYRTIFDPNGGTPSPVAAGDEVDVTFTGDGTGATGYAVITNGVISSIVLTSGGSGYTTAPTVTISATAGLGSGATATATIANGVVNGVAITVGGSGYVSANTPSGLGGEGFSSTLSSLPFAKPRLTYINDIHYGTGVRQPN